MDNKTDEEIIVAVQKGDKEAFGFLIERYKDKILRYARRFMFYSPDDAEDVVQDVFLKAYVNIKSFNTKKRFSPWLYRIAHNELINVIKKKGKEPVPFFDPDTLFPHPISKETADKDLNQSQIKEMLEQGMDKLNYKYREVLALHYFEEMDYKDIADILRVPVSTVGVRLKRGRESLKKLIDQINNPNG